MSDGDVWWGQAHDLPIMSRPLLHADCSFDIYASAGSTHDLLI